MLKIVTVTEEGAQLDVIRELFREYEKELNENICFQSFEKELEDPLIKYRQPTGIVLLAYWNDAVAGCIALQALPETGACEMKRLYVRPEFRKHGIGRNLANELVEWAKTLGYSVMRLDTLPKLQAAVKMYYAMGFEDCEAYYNNPLEGVIYMKMPLSGSPL